MKRCSVCDRDYSDGNLKFCTACGGTLVVDTLEAHPAHDPFKTMVATPRHAAGPLNAPGGAVDSGPVVNPSWDQIGSNIAQPAPGQEPSRGLALTAMIMGLVSLLCGVFVFLGPIAAIIGFVALGKVKSAPQEYTGHGFALVGVITGILATLLFIGGLIALGVMLATGGH
jgi:hypothetical protein